MCFDFLNVEILLTHSAKAAATKAAPKKAVAPKKKVAAKK